MDFVITLLIVIAWFIGVCIVAWQSGGSTSGVIAILLLSISSGLFVNYNNYNNNQPSALDVYRGNTTLEITSVNGVPKDTIVVFKNKN